MATDYPVRKPTRCCAATGREFAPGEAFISVLVDDGHEIVRRDYAIDQWNTAPEGALGWWRCQTPDTRDGHPAPREVLLGLLDEWADRPDQAAARYLLALLLVRRRVLKLLNAPSLLEGLHDAPDEGEKGILRLDCPDRDRTFEVAITRPTAEQTAAIQTRLTELLGVA